MSSPPPIITDERKVSVLTRFSMKDKPDEAAVESRDQEPTTLDELRNLLVGPEQIQIGRLKQRLDDPGLHAEDVSRVLAEAIALRSSRDDQVAKALEPSIEETLKASVRRNPKPLVEALFPVMGPAIGKAIFSAVRGMIQSLNQFFENNLSLQGVKWRLEAFRTKKPFPEIVSRHTLLYQVEHVFLKTPLTWKRIRTWKACALVIATCGLNWDRTPFWRPLFGRIPLRIWRVYSVKP